MADRNENLKSFNKLPPEVAREIQRKGAEASNKKQKANKQLREVLLDLLNSDSPFTEKEKKLQEQLKLNGIENPTIADKIMLKLVADAVEGKKDARELVVKTSEENTAKLEINQSKPFEVKIEVVKP